MIRSIHINNYKSINDVTLEVGRFNVFIGENGCGKSNFLEAIAMAAAAAAYKLDNDLLSKRGIRVTEPRMMRSAFSEESLDKNIKIEIKYDDIDFFQPYTLVNDNQAYTKWTRSDLYLSLISATWQAFKIDSLVFPEETLHDHQENLDRFYNLIAAAYKIDKSDVKNRLNLLEELKLGEDLIKNFIIFTPENSTLRNFYKEGQIEPLGANGEGLLKLLKVIQSKSVEQLTDIKLALELFDWYEELKIPESFSDVEDKIEIADRFLAEPLLFDQRSANEGFLYLLFYIALMVSDDTPKIFAVDNIDVALNPGLCARLISELARLAEKYNKQLFITSHNPAILDGIDLGDNEQRLFVTSRNNQGYTRFDRITVENKPRSATDEPVKLSEAFLRGYLGGLPKNF